MSFLGAAGKSAQIPLQTWLAHAMAGLHLYLFINSRGNDGHSRCLPVLSYVPVFELAPEVMMFISITGAVTLLGGWFCMHWFNRHQSYLWRTEP